jgi:ATP/maltotriose-dependent transcriptional regulator MalT
MTDLVERWPAEIVQSIYQKLAVASRSETLERAVDLRLL